MTYWRYWNLSSTPFSGDATQSLFRGATVEEAIARIEFLVTNRRHVGSLMGPSGVGKSRILRYCASNPPVGHEVPSLQTAVMSMLGLSSGELISELATRLTGTRRIANPQLAWKTTCDHFRGSERDGSHTVLLVDDTESSTAAAEDDLSRLLSMNFPLTIIFAVETQLASAVSRSLFDRTELQIELPGWEIMQTSEFLAWTCQRLGRKQPIFTDDAVQQIQLRSHGLPRRIIQLTDLAMVAGAVAQMNHIDGECIEQVAWELPKSSAA